CSFGHLTLCRAAGPLPSKHERAAQGSGGGQGWPARCRLLPPARRRGSEAPRTLAPRRSPLPPPCGDETPPDGKHRVGRWGGRAPCSSRGPCIRAADGHGFSVTALLSAHGPSVPGCIQGSAGGAGRDKDRMVAGPGRCCLGGRVIRPPHWVFDACGRGVHVFL